MGIIRRFVNNPVAANMLMLLVLIGGGVSAWIIPREFFPEISQDMVTVSVPYPGASPSEVEEGIVLKIEDAVDGLDGVKEITSESREGMGMVRIEATNGTDIRDLLDRVKAAVDQIYTFPKDAEEPSVVEVKFKEQVLNVAIAGDAPERTLKEIAEDIRDEIADLDHVSQASVSGTREYEISVEVSEESLRRHRLTLAAVAQTIRDSSFDLPAGTVKTEGGEIAIRVIGQKRWAEQFRTIPILYESDGTVVRLGDIAAVLEDFEDVEVAGQFNGKPSVLVGVFKTSDEDTLEIARIVREYIERKKGLMPEGVTIEAWADYSRMIRDRLNLLTRNGIMGLTLVFIVLLVFLNLRLSFWVALGIPFSVFGTIFVLNISGLTLNMISMFALIMALGLIVDDAIVVGENVFAHVERGMPPKEASILGTKEVIAPVIGAVATTWLAFIPLLLMPGVMGKFISILPVAVIISLAFSLAECVMILPPHLSHSLQRQQTRRERHESPDGRFRRMRRGMNGAIQGFINRVFLPAYRASARYRYVTLAAVAGVTAVMAGATIGGRIQMVTFPKMDSDTLQARVVFPTGTPSKRAKDIARRITEATWKLNDLFEARSGEPVVQRVYSLIGQQSGREGLVGGLGAHMAEVIVELLPSERRGLKSEQINRRWRELVPRPADALQWTFGAFRAGPGGQPFVIRMLGENTRRCKDAALEMKDKLAGFPGVTDIEDDALPGKEEMKVTLKSGAHALKINLRSLASQLRDAFYGNESLKVQRGRDEIKVMVRYPQQQRRTLGDVDEMRVRTPSGEEVPFGEVANVRIERGYTTLRRSGRHSVVTVSADIDEDKANAEEILASIRGSGFYEKLRERFGVTVDFKGQRQQREESFGSLKVWYPLALIGIFTILATIFRSYFQPIIVMVAIPFGLVGAVIGHWIFGFEVTLLSMFGMVALTGIVVNDSLVLIDMINRRIRAGATVHDAVETGARDRFRPIFLTTATTVAGMGPLLAERSFQAQFLKPMVLSIAFGLTFATLLTLLVVPSLYLIGNDIRRALRWLATGVWPTPEEVLPRTHRPEAPEPPTETEPPGLLAPDGAK